MTTIEILYKKLCESQKHKASGFIDYNYYTPVCPDDTSKLKDIEKQLCKGEDDVEIKSY